MNFLFPSQHSSSSLPQESFLYQHHHHHVSIVLSNQPEYKRNEKSVKKLLSSKKFASSLMLVVSEVGTFFSAHVISANLLLIRYSLWKKRREKQRRIRKFLVSAHAEGSEGALKGENKMWIKIMKKSKDQINFPEQIWLWTSLACFLLSKMR